MVAYNGKKLRTGNHCALNLPQVSFKNPHENITREMMNGLLMKGINPLNLRDNLPVNHISSCGTKSSKSCTTVNQSCTFTRCESIRNNIMKNKITLKDLKYSSKYLKSSSHKNIRYIINSDETKDLAVRKLFMVPDLYSDISLNSLTNFTNRTNDFLKYDNNLGLENKVSQLSNLTQTNLNTTNRKTCNTFSSTGCHNNFLKRINEEKFLKTNNPVKLTFVDNSLKNNNDFKLCLNSKTLLYERVSKKKTKKLIFSSKESSISVTQNKVSLANVLRILPFIFCNINRSSGGAIRILFLMWLIIPFATTRGFDSMELINPRSFCQTSRYLSPQQRVLCRMESKMFKYIEEGILLSTRQCSKEFKNNRWNCSRNPLSFFRALVNQDTKESAFVHAIASAGVTYAVTTGCTKGDLLECGCGDSRVRSYDLLRQEAARRNIEINETLLLRAAAEFKWGGCGDNIDYGYKMSRHFFDGNERGDLKTRVVKHNYEAGRLAIKKHMKNSCKCHGLSGSCTIHTCWQKMPKFSEISSKLHWRYDNAIPVKMNNDIRSLSISRALWRRNAERQRNLKRQRGRKRRDSSFKHPSNNFFDEFDISSNITEPHVRIKRRRRGGAYSVRSRKAFRKHILSDEDLVYSQSSPDFCTKMKRSGSLGTQGRQCEPNGTGAGSCSELCCGRGYVKKKTTVTKPCRCNFKYCCEVVCEECEVDTLIYECR